MLASIKSNLAPPAASLVFSLVGTESGAVRVAWKGSTPLDASALLSAPTDHEERSALSEAQEFLREVLESGPVAAAEVRQEADSAGIAKRTLDRARQSLGVAAEREGEPGKRGGGKWFWRLPGIKVANPGGWHSKSDIDRTDSENAAYTSQKSGSGLRLPKTEGNMDAKYVGKLNDQRNKEIVVAGVNRSQRQAHGTSRPSADTSEAERLTVEEVQEVRRLKREGMKAEIAREAVLRKRGRASGGPAS